jgi:aspartyl-tRNA(Asn)/glutamyl-tRNA(Gln) amidotransferase subunit A
MKSRWLDYGQYTRKVIGEAALLTSVDYAQAQKVRRVGVAALKELFTTVDLVVTPTTAGGALAVDGLNWDQLIGSLFTPYWNAVGNPTLSVPMGFTADGLPLGFQIAGRPLEDGLVLKAGDAFQQLTDFHLAVPALALTEAVSA